MASPNLPIFYSKVGAKSVNSVLPTYNTTKRCAFLEREWNKCISYYGHAYGAEKCNAELLNFAECKNSYKQKTRRLIMMMEREKQGKKPLEGPVEIYSTICS